MVIDNCIEKRVASSERINRETSENLVRTRHCDTERHDKPLNEAFGKGYGLMKLSQENCLQ